MAQEDEPLEGVVEVDETYVGGRRKGFVWRRTTEEDPKEILWGGVERGGELRIKHIPNTGKWTMYGVIEKNIKPGSTINSDELPAYTNIRKLGYSHESVMHSKREYARGDVTTNRIENVWSHLKPSLTAVHRSVSPKYLQSYADEFAFRYNHRREPEKMFEILLDRAVS